MGLFDFVKAAGAALGLGREANAAPAADDVKRQIEDYDLGVEGLEVSVEGDKVVLKGEAESQEAREKAILAAGNIAGVAKVEDAISTKDGEQEAVFHTVEKGDTLWAISSKHLGEGSKYMAIFEANKPMLSDPDKIYPGQVLRIPKA